MNVSAECDHCYAESRDRRMHGHDNWGKDALRLYHVDSYWRQLRKWNREAEVAGERRRVFEGSLCDVMEDRPDLIEPRNRLLAEVEATPWLDHLMLTKRPHNFRKFLPSAWLENPLPNVWLGTTVGVNKSVWRIGELRNAPARVRFLSIEPLLEYVDLSDYLVGLHWVIFGGESGPKARPCNQQWIQSGVSQCRAAGVAPFVKQLGSYWAKCQNADPEQWTRIDSHGADWEQWPGNLRVREFPISSGLT